MAISIEDLQSRKGFTLAEQGKLTWLPEPPRAERAFTVISVDDHVVEPPHAFEGRMPKKFEHLAPRIVTRPDGRETWVFNDQELPNVGFNAVVGRPVSVSAEKSWTVVMVGLLRRSVGEALPASIRGGPSRRRDRPGAAKRRSRRDRRRRHARRARPRSRRGRGRGTPDR